MQCATDKWNAEVRTSAIDKVLDVEVIGAVRHNVMAFQQRTRIVGIEEAIDRDHIDTGAHQLEPTTRGRHLRMPDVRFRIERLALQIGCFHTVAINDRKRRDPKTGQFR